MDSRFRPEVQAIIDRLLSVTPLGGEIGLDQVGDEIGTQAISSDEVGAIFEELEGHGRTIVAASGDGAADLRRVLVAARALESRLGRKPGIDEIAEEAGIRAGAVRAALLLGRVMGR